MSNYMKYSKQTNPDMMTKGYYWVKTKDPLQQDWSAAYIEYIDQDVIDFAYENGWNKNRVWIIQRVEEKNENSKTI